MAVSQQFCVHCGAPHSGNVAFCISCGNRLLMPAAAPQPPVVQYPRPMQSNAPPNAGAYPSRMPAPVQNWQVVVGGQLPVIAPQQQPIAAMVAPQPAPPAARSLRGSVIWTAAAACTDLAAAYATANPAAMATANYRAGFAGVSLVAGLIAGRRRGVVSVIVMLATLGLSLLEGMTLWGFVQQIPGVAAAPAGSAPQCDPASADHVYLAEHGFFGPEKNLAVNALTD